MQTIREGQFHIARTFEQSSLEHIYHHGGFEDEEKRLLEERLLDKGRRTPCDTGNKTHRIMGVTKT